MLKTVEGIFRDGVIELAEVPADVSEAKVIVTFLPSVADRPGAVDLASRGIDPVQAADLRRRLETFAEDWDRPEMDVYDAL